MVYLIYFYTALITLYIAFLVGGGVICYLYARICRRKQAKNLPILIKKQGTPNKKSYKSINDYLYGLSRYYSILIGRIPSHRVRKFLMRHILCLNISKRTVLYGGFEIRSPWNISIGDAVIGVNALLDGRRGITIHDNVCLAQNVKLYTMQHDINDSNFSAVGAPIEIQSHAWISSGTTILPGCDVGEGCVLASGAIATKKLDAFCVYAGIPAKKISERSKDLNYKTVNGYWHFY